MHFSEQMLYCTARIEGGVVLPLTLFVGGIITVNDVSFCVPTTSLG
jgi:hypothetical protein